MNKQSNPIFQYLMIFSATSGSVLLWYIAALPQSYYNLSFLFMYAISLSLVALPLTLAKQVISNLSDQKSLVGILSFITQSQRFRFVSLLITFFVLLCLIWGSVNFYELMHTVYQGHTHIVDLNHTKFPIWLVAIITGVLLFLALIIPIINRVIVVMLSVFIWFGLIAASSYIFYQSPFIFSGYMHFPSHILSSLVAWKDALNLALMSLLLGSGLFLMTIKQYKLQSNRLLKLGVFVFGIAIFLMVSLYEYFLIKTQSVNMILQLLYYCSIDLSGFLFLLVLLKQLQRYFTIDQLKGKYFYMGCIGVLITVSLVSYWVAIKVDLKVFNDWMHVFMPIFMSFIMYVITLLIAWVYDMQRLVYKAKKVYQIRFGVVYSILVRIVIPTYLLMSILSDVVYAFQSKLTSGLWQNILLMMVSLILTIIIGASLHKRFQRQVTF